MVLIGKKAKALLERVEALESNQIITDAQIKVLNDDIKELKETIERMTNSDSSKVSGKQLIKEWFYGAQEEDK